MTNVLLVDDNSKYLKDALPFYGYSVETALDGVGAMKLLSNSSNSLQQSVMTTKWLPD